MTSCTLQFLLSRLDSLSPPSLCFYDASSALITFVALHWTLFGMAMLLILRSPELDSACLLWTHQHWAERKDYLHWFTGKTFSDTYKGVLDFPCHKVSFLALVPLGVHLSSPCLPSCYPDCLLPALVHEKIPPRCWIGRSWMGNTAHSHVCWRVAVSYIDWYSIIAV